MGPVEAAQVYREKLTGISRAAELLRNSQGDRPGEMKDTLVQYIAAATRSFSKLIDDLAWYEKLNSGRIQAIPGTYPIRALVEDARLLLPEFDSDLRLKVEWANPPEDVFIDGCLAAVALSKVLRNAWVYSGQDSEVNLVVHSDPGAIRVQVRDHGIGIPVDELSMVGEPLYRGSNVAHIAGSGMGLGIARACMVALGGQIRLERGIDKGTTVQLTIPWGIRPTGF